MQELVDVLLSMQYTECRAWDEVLCPSCRFLAGYPVHITSFGGVRGPPPLMTMGGYDGPSRCIVFAAKHSARTDVTDFLDKAGACLGTALGGVLGVTGPPAASVGSLEGRPSFTEGAVEVQVVPAPSSWKGHLWGRQAALPLARAVAQALATGVRPDVHARVVDAVRLHVGATSQSGKVGAQHTVGRVGSTRALTVPGHGVRIVAVDDVATTDAMVREMERVLGGLDAVVTLCRTGLVS